MASAAATAALATEVLAVQRLYYNITPNPATSIFLLLSSQLLGYGIGGMMRCTWSILATVAFASSLRKQQSCFILLLCFIQPSSLSSPCLMHFFEAKTLHVASWGCSIWRLLGKLHTRTCDCNSLVNRSIFIWELFPEWIFPMLTGFSIMCLAAPNSTTVSHLFGGSNGNEGIGILSLCLDWQVCWKRLPIRKLFDTLVYSMLVLSIPWPFPSKSR